MTVSLVKHKCTPDCVGYCHWHGRHEPTAGYRVCFECGHVFLTERNLIEAHNRVVAELNADQTPNYWPTKVIPDATSGEEVFCCPFCIHDF